MTSTAYTAVGPGPSPDHPPTLRMLRFTLHAMFYALLAAGLSGGAQPADLVVGVLLGLAYAAGGLAAVRSSRTRLWLWLALVTGLWVALAALNPAAGYVAFPLFLLHLHLLPPHWSLPAVAALTAVVVAAQSTTTGGLTSAKVVGPCVGAVVAVLTAYGYAALYRESTVRQRLIDDLVRTRDRLADSQREAGRLAERQRLAREIHDTLAQGLSSIVLLARSAESALPPGTGSGAARERIREMGATAADNLAEARRFVAALTPPPLEDATLPEALRRVAAALGPVPRAEFRLDGEAYPLPVEAEVALLRLTQEALANVQRHAGARRATVTLCYLDDQVTLDVYDDGRGFDPDAASTAGRARFGLHGMRERIAELGGALTIESAPGEGTAVAAALPLAALTSAAGTGGGR
ncbi:sensor histidine kinase [Streptacidiphilus sp. P02-A3a]|uniref:sensor histidine kinase n=1 Tax=Streptacidiphilus sp. P02-A3a TaxID=2704468 RepID=UPI001CDCB0BF|nr:sensor histidine kinase [Streptacidiphilus sp. P02-A3a]